jgi:hypothetical protein
MLRQGRQLPLVVRAIAQPLASRPNRDVQSPGPAAEAATQRRRTGSDWPDQPPGSARSRRQTPREIPYLLLFRPLPLAVRERQTLRFPRNPEQPIGTKRDRGHEAATDAGVSRAPSRPGSPRTPARRVAFTGKLASVVKRGGNGPEEPPGPHRRPLNQSW